MSKDNLSDFMSHFQQYSANPAAGPLTASAEDLFPELAEEILKERRLAEEYEQRLERLEPLADQLERGLPLLQVTAKCIADRKIERDALNGETHRLRGYIDPLWQEATAFATTVFGRAGVEHAEWPVASAEFGLDDAKSWFANRAEEFKAGIDRLQKEHQQALHSEANDAGKRVMQALADQKHALDIEATKCRETALAAQKTALEAEATKALEAALAAQKKELEEKANSAKVEPPSRMEHEGLPNNDGQNQTGQSAGSSAPPPFVFGQQPGDRSLFDFTPTPTQTSKLKQKPPKRQ